MVEWLKDYIQGRCSDAGTGEGGVQWNGTPMTVLSKSGFDVSPLHRNPRLGT